MERDEPSVGYVFSYKPQIKSYYFFHEIYIRRKKVLSWNLGVPFTCVLLWKYFKFQTICIINSVDMNYNSNNKLLYSI
jgi:hypothetical protein